MRQYTIHIARFTALVAGSLLILAAAAFGQEQSVVVQPEAAPPLVQPAQQAPAPQPVETMPTPVLPPAPTMPAPAATNGSEPMPAPVTAPIVHPTPPISYHTGPRARRMLRCQDEVQLVMVAKNPIDCCLYEIPLCVPACCEGQPAMSEGRGIFGRGVVEYCWPCGFKAKVKFRPVLCDVKVDYTVN